MKVTLPSSLLVPPPLLNWFPYDSIMAAAASVFQKLNLTSYLPTDEWINRGDGDARLDASRCLTTASAAATASSASAAPAPTSGAGVLGVSRYLVAGLVGLAVAGAAV